MPLQIVKQLAVEEDIEFGIGPVTQPRDADGDGVAEDIVYTKVSSSSLPHLQLDGSTESDVRTELNDKFSMSEADARFAEIDGDPAQVFSVANPTAPEHAVNEGYLATYTATQLNGYALKTEVLIKTNLLTYTPTSDYHPCTKKYADDLVVAAGAGDMLKSVYDNNNNGTIDNAEALSGVAIADVNAYKGDFTDADSQIVEGLYECSNGSNVPETGVGLLNVSPLKTSGGYVAQWFYSFVTQAYYTRDYNGTLWSAWETTGDELIVVNDLLGNSDPLAVLSADQGKILADQITVISSTNVPVGGIIMFDGFTAGIPSNWNICDGANGTPDLTDKFIRGTASEANIGNAGGSDTASMPNHRHTGGAHTHTASHNHTGSSNSTGAHTHTVSSYSTTRSQGTYNATPIATLLKDTATRTTSNTGSHSHSITVNTKSLTTSSAGGVYTSYESGGGDNKPAYYTLMYIKRTA